MLRAEDSVTQSKVVSLAIERSPSLQLIDIVQDGLQLLDYLSGKRGANTCIVKLMTVEGFDKFFLCLGNYWSPAATPMND